MNRLQRNHSRTGNSRQALSSELQFGLLVFVEDVVASVGVMAADVIG